jgi:hypothetical protein
MKLIAKIFALFIFFSTPVLAQGEPAFIWPDSYSFTSKTSSKTGEFEPFINVYYKDKLKARNQTKTGVEIFRVDLKKKYSIDKAGKVTESALPDDWSLSAFFPPNSEWKFVNMYTSGKYNMNKYQLIRGAEVVDVWLSSDDSIPVGIETKDTTIEFFSYSTKSSDPKLFEPPVK